VEVSLSDYKRGEKLLLSWLYDIGLRYTSRNVSIQLRGTVRKPISKKEA
jgi:hypothetical protein